MTTTTETWLDVMPAIPLAYSVPVRPFAGGGTWRGVVIDCTDRLRVHVFVVGRGLQVYAASDLRVDLDDPQGFAYAFRFVTVGRIIASEATRSVLWRWAHGTTTDADRLALARALARVV